MTGWPTANIKPFARQVIGLHCDELRPVREHRLDLDFADHLGDAVDDLVAGDYVSACLPQLSDGLTVPRPLRDESLIGATAPRWLSLTPRSSLRRATTAAMAIVSLSFARGVRCMAPAVQLLNQGTIAWHQFSQLRGSARRPRAHNSRTMS